MFFGSRESFCVYVWVYLCFWVTKLSSTWLPVGQKVPGGHGSGSSVPEQENKITISMAFGAQS
jgi:hypothetical protein